jgi:hypothetical protein
MNQRLASQRLAGSALVALAAAALWAAAGACGNDRIRRNTEAIQVVSGQPGVGQSLPGVQRDNPDAGPVYGGAAPYQVDSFSQPPVQKVDILWVIDSSPSMDLKQDRVKTNAQSFIQFLTDQQIDYHLGVVSTDVFDPARSGKLINFAGLTKPWIDPTDLPPGGAKVAFVQNASVGAVGSTQERAFLAGMLALTPPLNAPGGANCASATDCFLRADADLYVILMSDEEEKSCTPLNRGGYTNEEGCNNAQANLTGYGSIEYWTRFYTGIKGPGHIVRVAAIAGTDSTFQRCKDVFAGACDSFIAAFDPTNKCSGAPDCTQFGNLSNPCCKALVACSRDIGNKAQWCEVHQTNVGAMNPPYYSVTGIHENNQDLEGWTGCVAKHADASAPSGYVVDFAGFTGTRYTTVAQNTGGQSINICDADYTPGLAKLGLQATGLRADFPLSRAPIDGTLVVTVKGAQVPTGPNTWQYVRCSGSTPANLIHFAKAGLPGPGDKIAASYDVNVRGLGACP